MKFFIFLSSLIIFSCKTNTETSTRFVIPAQSNAMNTFASSNETSTEPVEDFIFIKDSSDYSTTFLIEMKKKGIQNASLVDSFLILDHIDTVIFPQTPKIGKKTVLTARKDNLAIALTIERVNQTSIDYKIEMVEFGNSSNTTKGQADLNPHFYLGSETDESSLSGYAYLSTEFIDNSHSCYTYIRLGREEDSGPYLLGKIKKNCNGKLRTVELDNFPTLIEK